MLVCILHCPLQVSLNSVKQLEQTKRIFENQLRELELRLEQEAKVVQCSHTLEETDIISTIDCWVSAIHNGLEFHTSDCSQ